MDIIALIKAESDKVARQLNGLNAALAPFAGTYKTGSSRPTGTVGKGESRKEVRAPNCETRFSTLTRLKLGAAI